MTLPSSSLALRSRLQSDGWLRLSLDQVPIAAPVGQELLVAMQAAPVNPTDLNLLLAGADLANIETDGQCLRIPVGPDLMAAHRRRLDQSLGTGLEGAGLVIATGPDSRHLLGRTVAVFGTGAFGTHRLVQPQDCIVFGDDVSADVAAGAIINPMTALCMLDRCRRDGHRAIIHTAAGSSLGRMLERACVAEAVPVINILRHDAAAAALRADGSAWALASTADSFDADLVAAIRATDASIAFDAIGAGPMIGRILAAMEEVFAPPPEAYDIYGSRRMKQICVYGGLNPGPIEVPRRFGMAWQVSGWLMMNHLATLSPEQVAAMKARIAQGITTTFRTDFAEDIALHDLLSPDRLRMLRRMESGRKVRLRLG